MQLEINNSFIRVEQGGYTLELHNSGRVYITDNIDVVSIRLDDLKAMIHAVEVAMEDKEGANL